MNNYKEPEMDVVTLEDEKLDIVSGGACVNRGEKNDIELCGKVICGPHSCSKESIIH